MKDKFILGLLYGLVLPALVFFLGDLVLEGGGHRFSKNFFYILCIGANVLIFRFAIKKDKDKLARGILFSTFVYALLFAFIYLKK